MRSFWYSAAAVLLALLLLYGGLNVVERSMVELMALEREPGAFSICRQEGGGIAVTFGGSTSILDPAELLESIKGLWERYR
jgi:hypothetical protein